MPEFKNTFQGGKMEKDLDERIVPSGVYREALNISVSTSEDSDVGTAQNILANIKVTRAINGPNMTYSACSYSAGGAQNGRYYGTNAHIAAVVDPQTDMIYRFVNTTPNAGNNHGVWMDRIVEYDTTKSLDVPWHDKEKSVLIDIYKVVTKFQSSATTDPENCNKSIIEVCTNTYQLREGMTLHIAGESSTNAKGPFIEHINYSGASAQLYLSDNVDDVLPDQGADITFRGDRVLNFDPSRKITGINIMDGMIFWTDNYSEPKKVNIKRSKQGSNSRIYGAGWNPLSPNSQVSYGCFSGSGSCYSDFDMHTKLIVDDVAASSCDKQNIQCPIYGCMDPIAENYDANANTDDGSCTYPPPTIDGCMDPLACNYNASATQDDSSCDYPGECERCDWGCVNDSAAFAAYAQDGSGSVVTISNAWDCYSPNGGGDGIFCNSNWTCIPDQFYESDCSDRDEAAYDKNDAGGANWNYTGVSGSSINHNYYAGPTSFLHEWSRVGYNHVLDNFYYWRVRETGTNNFFAYTQCWGGNVGECEEPTEQPNCIDYYTNPQFQYAGDPTGTTLANANGKWRYKDTIKSMKLWVTGGGNKIDPSESIQGGDYANATVATNPIIEFDLSVWTWSDIVSYLRGNIVHGEHFCFDVDDGSGGGSTNLICPEFDGTATIDSDCPDIPFPDGTSGNTMFADPNTPTSYGYGAYPKTIGQGVLGEIYNGCTGSYWINFGDEQAIQFMLEYHTESCGCANSDATTTPGDVTFYSDAPYCEEDSLGLYSDESSCLTSPCESEYTGWTDGDWGTNPTGEIWGCTDPGATNYNPSATQSDGSCQYNQSTPVGGCMQPNATNFQEYVNFDDGTCYWCSMVDEEDNAFTSVLADGDACSACSAETHYSGYDYVTDGGWVNTQSYYPSNAMGCTDPGAFNYDENASCNDGSCEAIVMGCTDPLAINYYSDANIDDGSCMYAGCTDPTADNYDDNATVDDNSCCGGVNYGLCTSTSARVATPPPTTPPPTIPPINTPLSSPRTTPDREQRMDEGYNLPSPLKNGGQSASLWYCCQDPGGCTDNINSESVLYGVCYQAAGADIPSGQQGYSDTTQCGMACSQATWQGGGINISLDDSAFDDYWGEATGPSVTITETPEAVVNPIRGGVTDPEANFIMTCSPEYVLEKHITVIRRGPTAPPKLQMYSWADDSDLDNDDSIVIETSFNGGDMPQISNWYSGVPFPDPQGTGADGSDTSIFFTPQKEVKQIGDHVILPLNINDSGVNNAAIDWEAGMKLKVTYNYADTFGNAQIATCRLVVINTTFTYLWDNGQGGGNAYAATHNTDVGPYMTPGGIKCKILAISEDLPVNGTTLNDIYTVRAEQVPPLFEFKFPKFAYRYKYEDGEYSVFGPWSEIAFMPGEYDYLPKKGYNLGMVNTMRSLKILDWNPKNRPRDVVEIDILYKESNSTNVYTVATFKPSDVPNDGGINEWNTWGTGSNKGNYTITSELIHKVVPSNQMLRPWDNVPRVALGQEITANRLIYANYLQNYNYINDVGEEIKPSFGISVDSENYSLDSDDPLAKQPLKSLKSMRTYQLGVVYRDRYGRETPVLTSNSGSIDIPKASAKLKNSLSVEMTSPPPAWAESYTFYIKETSNEYYNLAMDRWYNAEDDGLWLSFPSSERNKVTERSMLILKKQHDTDVAVDSDIRYKILDIKNSAPTFIKTEYQFWGSIPMMLPPPGWGEGTKAGNWDTGMFHITGLPLPNRLYIDVYAEYFDQSVLADLTKSTGAQVRITQTIGAPSSYNSPASQSVNKSKWYDVANISYIGSPQQMYTETVQAPNGNEIEVEQEVPGQAEQIVRITLENIIGEDMAFCEPTDNLSLSRGLSLEARTQVVKDRSQFEGRFFVKVLRDSEIQTHIVQSGQAAEDDYQILMSRDVKYVCMAHPGVQDWMTGAAGTVGASKGKWYGNRDENGDASSYNYLPVGKRWIEALITHNPNNLLTGGGQWIKAEVSSLHDQVGWATYQDASNAAATPSQTVDEYWPMGPGASANIEYMSGWFLQKYYNYLMHDVAKNFADFYDLNFGTTACPGAGCFGSYGGIDTNVATGDDQSIWPDFAEWANPWPSFMTSSFQPAMCGGTGNPAANATWGVDDCKFLNAKKLYRGNWDYGLDLSLKDGVLTTGLNPAFRAKRGANPFNVPAIWGDQSDLLGYEGCYGTTTPTALSNADTTALRSQNPGGGISAPDYPSHYNASTIVKLRKDWYNLWWGRDKIDDQWPLGRFSPERWFIDKVGAADKYSGNGIWVDDNGVSHMDLSFYGIGNLKTHYRSYDTITFQENEFAFGDAMSTTGTQFRFKQDPNGTVYTITRAEIQYVKNYEVGQGSYGYNDPDWQGGSSNGTYTCLGGGGMGSGICPPWGSLLHGDSSIAGKEFFISDLFNRQIEMTGGAPYNYRVRISITLDKEIGSEGIQLGAANLGFHPIKNHVDIDGNCNIKYGAQRYYSGGPGGGSALLGWKAEADTFTEEEGGTPDPYKFFNLSSYWNVDSSSTPTEDQSDQAGVGDQNGQHFGLHERGLNATTIEIITPYKGDEGVKNMSRNPAVWETEPMEDVGLDIYYAASPTYPINLQKIRSDAGKPDPIDKDRYNNTTGANWFDYGWRGEEVVPVGALVEVIDCNGCGGQFMNNIYVSGVQGNTIWIVDELGAPAHLYEDGGVPLPLSQGFKVRFKWQGEGYWYGGKQDEQYIELEVLEGIDEDIFKVLTDVHTNTSRSLSYFNCYTFNNGVESNRIRDDYNAVQIDKGVKASMPLATTYEEERKASSLIFSGIYNSTSGVNDTNQFIQAEPITKDLNPINGSIQKLFARDTDLVTFCENKVFKILAKKDALFNADGNTNVTSNAAVLGQSIAFSGEYGISKNPESFASESYRIYFADKARGAVLRLSRDGLTPISDQGMKDWFKDNLRFASSIIGSYDDRDDQYNITIETEDQDGNPDAYTLSYVEKVRGWVSFKSFVHQNGLSHKNIYYTWPSTVYSTKTSPDPWGVAYSTGVNNAETYQHGLDIEITRYTSTASSTNSIIVGTGTGVLLKDMNVQGNGVPIGTIITNTSYSGGNWTVGVNNTCFVQNNQKIKFTTARNNFYETPHYSMVKTLFNKGRGNVLRYKTLSYEGSQAQVVPRGSFANFANYHQLHGLDNITLSAGLSNMVIEDNYQKEGWYVNNIFTDLQKGDALEFINKENRWYNYIRGKEDAGWGDDLDTGEFSLQGIGIPVSIT